MKKFIIAAASAASVVPAFAQSDGSDAGLTFVSDAAAAIGQYNGPIVALLTACFAIVMIFVGYKIAKRSVSKA